jgi:hypothetical protein
MFLYGLCLAAPAASRYPVLPGKRLLIRFLPAREPGQPQGCASPALGAAPSRGFDAAGTAHNRQFCAQPQLISVNERAAPIRTASELLLPLTQCDWRWISKTRSAVLLAGLFRRGLVG